jgi:hypothetical protein
MPYFITPAGSALEFRLRKIELQPEHDDVFAGADELRYGRFTPQRTGLTSLNQKPKIEVLSPRNAMALDTLAGVRGEMARLYRLGLNGRIPSDEMTKFVYTLKEIRACLEAETLIDVQQRLAALTRDMGDHNGRHVYHHRTLPRS